MLEALGFKVLESCDGENAIHFVEHENPVINLVISDFNMHRLNGVETLTTLSAMRPGLKGILCSSFSEWECLGGKPLDGCIYLSKPFGIRELDAAVHQMLAQAV